MVAESGVVRSERRGNRRSPVFCAVELSSVAKPRRCGVTRNASDKGLLIVTPSRFAEGDRLDVSVYLRGAAAKVTGHVVRVDVNPATSNELWRYRLAVALDEPLPADLLDDASTAARAARDGAESA
jgi:hypothetical protein